MPKGICPSIIQSPRKMIEEGTEMILAEKGDYLLVESALFWDKGIVYVSNKNRHDEIWSFKLSKEEINNALHQRK